MNSNVICTMQNYIGYTCRHLHQRVEEHKHSVIGKHFLEKHNLKRMNLNTNFKVLKKCRGKLECLIFEMLIIRNKRPTLNTQADSIRAKLFNRSFAPFSRLNLTLHIPDSFFFCIYIYHQFMLIFFAFDNDDMESSKRRVTFLTLIFLLKCMSKSIVIWAVLNSLKILNKPIHDAIDVCCRLQKYSIINKFKNSEYCLI